MNALLDQIVANTADEYQNNKIILIRNSAELLTVAKRTDVEPVESIPKTIKERYFYEIFRELFKDVGFFYRQVKAIAGSTYSETQIDRITSRLKVTLESISESYPAIEKYFWDVLKTDNRQDMETAVFILSSLQSENSHVKESSKLFEAFVKCSPQELPSYIEAFKHSISQGVCRQLQQIANSTTIPGINESCKVIIDFRKQFNGKLYKIEERNGQRIK